MENLSIEQKGGAILIGYSGELTLDTTPGVRSEVQAAQEGADFACMIVDLSEVGFMDSSGIGYLVSLASRVEDGGRSFHLYRPSAQVLRTLDLVQLKKYFKVLNSEAELAPLML
ncbi:STAS domain-containing protein [Desulfocurvus sp. DL9XJH121]